MTVLVSLPTRCQAQEELRAWSAVPDDLIDIGAAALALAALHFPDCDTTPYREHLDRLATEVALLAQGLKPQRVEQIAAILTEIIAGRYGYQGDDVTYGSPDNANLLRVIDRKRGLPVALGLFYLSAARANGWDAVGLNFPDHFLIRIEFNGRRIIIDPFNSGSVVTVPRLRELTKSKLGPTAELKPEYYMPISTRDVLMRLQNNLKLRFIRAGVDEAASEVIEGMLLLDPGRAPLWREFGLLLTRLGEENRAITALENYLVLASDDSARHQTAILVEQLKSLSPSGNN